MRKIACAFYRIKANSKNQTYPIHNHLRPIFADYFGNIAVKCYQKQEKCYQTNESVTNYRI